MAIQIEQYVLNWHPTNGASYRIKLSGRTWGPWNRVPPSDLAAIAAILNESPCYVNDDGSIGTGPEPVGGA